MFWFDLFPLTSTSLRKRSLSKTATAQPNGRSRVLDIRLLRLGKPDNLKIMKYVYILTSQETDTISMSVLRTTLKIA